MGYKGQGFKNRTGEKHLTKEGYLVEIIEYFEAKNCTIQFENGLILRRRNYNEIKSGSIKNPYHPSVYGVGFIGVGKYVVSKKSVLTKEYNLWIRVLERSFNSRQDSYKDITTCDKWRNFQTFAEWVNQNYNLQKMKGWHLDKDILVKGNKIYSPETCCFVPAEINNLFTKRQNGRGDYPIGVSVRKGKITNIFEASFSKGRKTIHIGYYSTSEEAFQAYKVAKELWIQEVANRWQGKITEQVYQSLINYKIEITD